MLNYDISISTSVTGQWSYWVATWKAAMEVEWRVEKLETGRGKWKCDLL